VLFNGFFCDSLSFNGRGEGEGVSGVVAWVGFIKRKTDFSRPDPHFPLIQFKQRKAKKTIFCLLMGFLFFLTGAF